MRRTSHGPAHVCVRVVFITREGERMRELFLVPEESSATSLVFRTEDGGQFFLDFTSLDVASTRALLLADVPDTTLPEESAAPAAEDIPAEADGQTTDSAATQEAARERILPAPDPLLTAPLTMRPREIQGRIRAGASVDELAEEMGVAPSRVEPFAHPVLLERAR